MTRPFLIFAPLALTTACFAANGRTSTSDESGTTALGDPSEQIQALAAQVDALTTRIEAEEAESASLREELNSQSTAIATLEDALGANDGGTEALGARLDALEARGTVGTASGGGTGTCAYLSTDVVAGRPVVIVATLRGYGNAGYYNGLYGYGGTVSASVSATGGGASGSASLTTANAMATGNPFYSSSWSGTDTRTFTLTPTSDGEMVVSMNASTSSSYGSSPAPTIDVCSIVAFQI
jgi:hypothetical protein